MQPHDWDEIEKREIALEASADIRTVKKFLSGSKVKGMVADRIQRAIARRLALNGAGASK